RAHSCTASSLASSHTFAVPSELPIASRLPSGDQDTELFLPVYASSSRPPDASHTLTVPPSLPVASRLPSGDQDKEWTLPVCPLSVSISRPSAAFQILPSPTSVSPSQP